MLLSRCLISRAPSLHFLSHTDTCSRFQETRRRRFHVRRRRRAETVQSKRRTGRRRRIGKKEQGGQGLKDESGLVSLVLLFFCSVSRSAFLVLVLLSLVISPAKERRAAREEEGERKGRQTMFSALCLFICLLVETGERLFCLTSLFAFPSFLPSPTAAAGRSGRGNDHCSSSSAASAFSFSLATH